MHQFIEIIVEYFSNLGYIGITFLMTIESSFIPFPSEIVIPPASFAAQQGRLNIWFVIFAGIAGSLIGATINYILAYKLGRSIVYKLAGTKLAKMLMIDELKIKKAEDYFLQYGNTSTFIGRLIPGVRQLISVPAGFSKMKFKSFILFTFLGSSFWISILAILGYFFGANRDLFEKFYKEATIAVIALSVLYIFFLFYNKRKKKNTTPSF